MVAISKNLILHGLDYAAVKTVTADSSSALTFGTLYELQNMQELALTPKVNMQELRAKGEIISVYSRLESIPFTFTNATMGMDVLAVLTGADAPTAGGTTPNQTQTLNIETAGLLPYFKFEGKINYVESPGGDVGDVHIILWKCKLTDWKFSLTQDGFASVSGGGTALATVNTGYVMSLVANETAVDVS